MEDKHVLFLVGSFLFVPLGILFAMRSTRILNIVFIALVFSTTQPDALFGLPTDINFMSREWYRGSTRGFEVSLLDLLALILLVGSLSERARNGNKFVKPPSYGLMKTYFVWALFTVLFISEPKIFGAFELSKMFRAMLVFLAVWAFMRSPAQVRLFVYAIIGVVLYETAVALYDRYVVGVHRVQGTLGHPNSLSMYCLQIFPIMISVWFAQDATPKLRMLCLLASIAIAGVVILTISRTGFASLAVLLFLSLVFNIRSQWTPRNIGIMLIVLVIGSFMVIKSWDTLSSRFQGTSIEHEYLTEGAGRGSYFQLGWPALADNPIFGVGLNNWSYWISNRYANEAGNDYDPYLSTEFAPPTSKQAAPAHNLYLLTAVELGWVGLFLLLALFGRWLYISGAGLTRGDGDLLDRVRVGALLSLCGVLMQSVTEWEFRQTSLFFLGHITMSVAAYLYYSRRGSYKK